MRLLASHYAAEVIERARKKTGKYSVWYNVEDLNGGEIKTIKFELVAKWKY